MTHECPLACIWARPQRAEKTLPQPDERREMRDCWLRQQTPDIAPLIRATFGNTFEPSFPATGSAEWPPDDRLRRGIQYAAACRVYRLWNTGSSGRAGRRRRGLGHPSCLSFGIAAGRKIRLEQARNAVPATNRQWFWLRIWSSKGSGNADSQRKVRSSGWSGQGCPRDSGCVRAHPASWRASASYRPLRAVWAFAPGHSGVLSEITRPFSAQ